MGVVGAAGGPGTAPAPVGREGGNPGLDLRLLGPALLAWAADVGLLWSGAPVGIVLLVALVAMAAPVTWLTRRWIKGSRSGTSSGLRRSRSGRFARRRRALPWARGADVLALCGAATGLVVIALAGYDGVRTAGLLDELAAQSATVSVTAVVDSDPRVLPVRSGRRVEGRQVIVRLVVEELVGRGMRTASSAPLLVLGDETWLGIHYRETVSLRGRLAPTEPGDDVVAILHASAAPELLADAPAVVS